MKIVVARYGEVHLKGNNRGAFLRVLTRNLAAAAGDQCKVVFDNGRYLFTDFKPDKGEQIAARVARVFGIVSASVCNRVAHDRILDWAKTLRVEGSFKVVVNRADKKFPHTSQAFAPIVGGVVLDNNPNARVDVHTPETVVNIDIREGNIAFVYDKVIPGVGGMPVGTAGRAIVMLSGGIDSPVAAYLAAKRGLAVDYVHFASPPYTSDMALDKVKRLRDRLREYCLDGRLYVVPFTDIQTAIRDKCSPEYMITLMRRFMVRIAGNSSCDCMITGENLAQVASQTIQGITTNNAVAQKPILRPLICYDKSEIVVLAKKIGTYDISIEPHLDCCTVFVPQKPVIAPTIKRCETEEKRLDVTGLVEQAIAKTTVM